MKLEQSFEVAAAPETVWEALIDVPRVAPCLPGASIVDRNGDGSYSGEFKVKIGPTSAAYNGRLTMEDVDAQARRCTLQAAGTDKRGQGGAKATIVTAVTSSGDGSKVEVSSDYHITGRLARFGRGGMIEEISGRLLGEFADNLQALLAAGGSAAPTEPAPAQPTPAVAEPTPPPAAETGDPDAVIEGALPVADALADEPATPSPEPAPSAAAAGPPPASWSLEQGAGASGGSVVVRRVKDNPATLAALVLGFLVALRVLRRRS